MPIVAADVGLMLSIKTGAAGGSATQPDPNQSLGKYVSTTVISGTSLNNLFDDISGAENTASVTDYRCFFIQNNHATLTMIGAAVWVQSQVASGAVCQIGVDPTAASALGSVAAQAVSIATELAVPAGVAFVDAATSPAAVLLGNITPGQVRAVWVKRSAQNTAAVNNDGLTIEIDFDTAA